MAIEKQDNRLVYRYDSETLWIEPWGTDGLRVRATKQSRVPEENWALLSSNATDAEIVIDSDTARITNGRITAKILDCGKLFFYNQNGDLLLEEYVRTRVVPALHPSALEVEAREFKPILGGDYALTMRFESEPEERLYGMGQYQQLYLNIKGCTMELAHRNSQACVPFVLSSLGYGFLWNNPGIGSVTFGRNVTEWSLKSASVLDYWITAGDNPAEILENYGGVTGTVPMMPEWAMGYWQCKLRYQTQDEILEVAREHKRRGLPLSVIVVDFFHWTMQGEWKFDPEYWPDPAGMIAELEEMGVKLMVSIWPTVDKRSENYREMLEKGYLIRTERGHRIAMDFLGDTVHYDATNPGARAYLWEKCKKNYYDYGVRVFWLDEAEPEYTYYDFDHYRYYLGPNVQIGNIYPMMHAKAFFDGMQAQGQQNIINLLRCAWAGSQRYGALVWSGDIASSFRSMRYQLAAGLNIGLAGIPWWTTDIGGFHGGDVRDPDFHELLVRWFEWAAFCPVMRMHGDREPHSEPLGTSGGGLCSSGAASEVWSFGEEMYGIFQKYMAIREKMRPYIAQLMRDAHEKGHPVMRPLFFDFPDDEAAWWCEDAYMFGPDVLVAPIMKKEQRSRQVYLPAGTEWKDAWTGEKYAGSEMVTVDAPLDRIPVFVRAGASVVL
jgi:alpha-D-xyloside xylohydrolase